MPGAGDAVERKDGIGIVRDTDMACLWRSSGRVWNGVSSRVVSIRLKLDTRAARPLFLTTVSVYVHHLYIGPVRKRRISSLTTYGA